MDENRYYLSDVLFGSALGMATGWTVVGRHGRHSGGFARYRWRSQEASRCQRAGDQAGYGVRARNCATSVSNASGWSYMMNRRERGTVTNSTRADNAAAPRQLATHRSRM